MQADITISCFDDPDGGVTLCMSTPEQNSMSLPMDHEAALRTAASILGCAGVRRAEFEDGQLREWA